MATAHARSLYAHHVVSAHGEIPAPTPPSPTLTNPDLILPDHPHYSSHSPSAISDRESASSRSGHRRDGSDASTELGVATAVVMPMRLSVGPPATVSRPHALTTYQGYEHGAPLSDIGEEETDIEDSASKLASKKEAAESSTPPKAEDTTEDAVKPEVLVAPPLRHKKRLSNISASSEDSDRTDWEQIDTSKLGSDRVAADIAQARNAANFDDSSRRNSKELEEELAVLNERAEHILANARKRLSHMEDNLSKARHSMILTSPRSSPNLHELAFGQQPAGGLYRSISQSAQTRRSRAFPVRPNSTIIAHGRAGSDAIVASSANRLSKIPETRSASAMEYRKSWIGHLTPERAQAAYSPTSNRSFNSPLRVLTEETTESPSTIQTSPDYDDTKDVAARRGLGMHISATQGQEDLTQVDQHDMSSTPTSFERSNSQASIRSAKELTDKMTEMKSRIAELKSKAQADSLRRRSLQSLRSASPFNNASSNGGSDQQWHSSPLQQERAGTSLGHAAGPGNGWRSISQQSHRPRELALDEDQYQPRSVNPVTPVKNNHLNVAVTPAGASSARTDRNTPNLVKKTSREQDETDFGSALIPSNYDNNTEQDQVLDDENDEIVANEEEQIYLNEVLEESLQEVEPDVPAIPSEFMADGSPGAAERHEDRLDAFDYENMFLHSAMGTYLGDRNSDEESDIGSVETSRQEMQTPTPSDGDDREREVDGTVDDDFDTETEGEDHQRHGEEMEFDTDEEMEAEMSSGEISSGTSPVQLRPETVSPGDPVHGRSSVDSLDSSHSGPLRKPWMKVSRSNSIESTSSTATFQTATEGGMYDVIEDDEEDGPDEILNWGNAPLHHSSPASQRNILPSSSPLGTYGKGHRRHDSGNAVQEDLGSSPPRMDLHDKLRSPPASPTSARSPSNGQYQYTISNSSQQQQHHARQYSHTSDLSDIEEQKTPQASTFPDSVKAIMNSHTKTPSTASTVILTTSKRNSSTVSTPNIPLPPTPPFPSSPSFIPSQNQPRPSSSRASPAMPSSFPSPGRQMHSASSTKSSPLVGSNPAPTTSSLYPANTEILMESLIKLADPRFSIDPNTRFQEVDKELVLSLLRAVGGVCDGILRAQRIGEQGSEQVDEMRHRLRGAAGALIHGVSVKFHTNDDDSSSNDNGIHDVGGRKREYTSDELDSCDDTCESSEEDDRMATTATVTSQFQPQLQQQSYHHQKSVYVSGSHNRNPSGSGPIKILHHHVPNSPTHSRAVTTATTAASNTMSSKSHFNDIDLHESEDEEIMTDEEDGVLGGTVHRRSTSYSRNNNNNEHNYHDDDDSSASEISSSSENPSPGVNEKEREYEHEQQLSVFRTAGDVHA